MPKDDVTRRRHALLVDITQAASEVSRLVHEARDLHLAATPSCAGPSCSTRSFPKPATANRQLTGPGYPPGAGVLSRLEAWRTRGG